MKAHLIIIAALGLYLPGAMAATVDDVQQSYQADGASSFSASAGEAMFKKEFMDAKSGKARSCQTCHTTNLKGMGKHAKTGKPIDPMAPSANAKRLTDAKKIAKWFKRNCKWTLGRECTAQEKGDFLEYLKQQ